MLEQFAAMTHDRDGFGAIIRRKNGRIEAIKSLFEAGFYMELGRVMIDAADIETLVVHHRTSTNGQGIDYAHPFQFLGYWLTHNGVVQVPGKHDTATTNDSEALLHHLVKNSFDVSEISGYLSCFVLSETETHVLVDETAPLFTDGRVFSSHDMGEGFSRISGRHLCLGIVGQVLSDVEIAVKDSRYGWQWAGDSIGYEIPDSEYSGARLADDYLSQSDLYPVRPDTFNGFLDCLTPIDETRILNARTFQEAEAIIDETAAGLGVKLSRETREDILRYFF